MIDNGDGVDLSQFKYDEQQIALINDTLSI